jgi:glycine cleavage system H lipoate-binding protein
MNMLDFIFELEKVIAKWPDSATWTLAQISDYTGASIPLVVDIMSDVLDREIEVHETVTHTESAKVLSTLKDRMAGQIIARQKRLEAQRQMLTCRNSVNGCAKALLHASVITLLKVSKMRLTLSMLTAQTFKKQKTAKVEN